jgi:hypothetical protein
MDHYEGGIEHKRQKLAMHIFQEVQTSNKQSSNSLYEVLYKEMNNISDRAIEIRFRQNEL